MVKQSLQLTFAKKGDMRFVSHLDLMRLFGRAARRAGVPVALTEGYNPHPRISIQPALKLGKTSDSLEAVLRLSGWMAPEDMKRRLQGALPEGIELKKIRVV